MNKALFGLILLGLAGCGEAPNPPLPVRNCVSQGEPTFNSKGGPIYTCHRWEIGCPAPLILADLPDGKLVCRLKKE